MDLISQFFTFSTQPRNAVAVATVLIVAFAALKVARREPAWPLLGAATLWLGTILLELDARESRANIRIDVVLLHPIILMITIYAVIRALASVAKRPFKNRKAAPIDES